MCLILFVYTNDFIADLCLDRKPRTTMFYDNSVSKYCCVMFNIGANSIETVYIGITVLVLQIYYLFYINAGYY